MAKEKKLNNAPLKEAIFELFWNIPIDNTGFPRDPNFENFAEEFKFSIKDLGFTLHKEFQNQLNLNIYPSVKHQYWKGELKWPVVQLGPGLFSFNDVAETYEWDSNYYPILVKSLDCLFKSSREKLKIQKVSLKYINSFDLDSENDFLSFISDGLNTAISNNFMINGKFKGMNIFQSFELSDKTITSISIQTVTNNINQKPAIVWMIFAEKFGDIKPEDFSDWLKFAHANVSSIFYNMLSEKSYASFI